MVVERSHLEDPLARCLEADHLQDHGHGLRREHQCDRHDPAAERQQGEHQDGERRRGEDDDAPAAPGRGGSGDADAAYCLLAPTEVISAPAGSNPPRGKRIDLSKYQITPDTSYFDMAATR